MTLSRHANRGRSAFAETMAGCAQFDRVKLFSKQIRIARRRRTLPVQGRPGAAPAKHALGLEQWVGSGSPAKTCANKNLKKPSG